MDEDASTDRCKQRIYTRFHTRLRTQCSSFDKLQWTDPCGRRDRHVHLFRIVFSTGASQSCHAESGRMHTD